MLAWQRVAVRSNIIKYYSVSVEIGDGSVDGNKIIFIKN